jgi:hypothetical protein
VASNEQWAVPAGSGERRWFVLDCSSKFKQDHDFFEHLSVEIDNGGLEAFMYELANRKITTNQRAAPRTEALTSIALHGLTSDQKWMFDALEKGSFPFLTPEDGDFPTGETDTPKWPNSVSKLALRKSYDSTKEEHRYFENYSSSEFSKRIIQLIGPLTPSRPRKGEKRAPSFKLPRLSEARKRFADSVQLSIEWTDS